MRDYITGYVEYAWIEIIYYIVTLIYIVKLHFLNKKLVNFVNEPLKLLSYDNYSALWYFLIAIILFIIGGIIIWNRIKDYAFYEKDLFESLVIVLNIFFVFACMVLIFIFINNPILQAIMTALTTFGILGYCLSKN